MQLCEYTDTNETEKRNFEMILESKQTTVAYRCPHCGAGVMSVMGVFSLTADMVKLKCDCGKSEMSVVYGKDGKVRLTVPCLVCANPHHFTVSNNIFFGRDLFVLPCPYSDINIAVMGEINQVKAELARGEMELLDLMEKSGIENFDSLARDEETLPDPQILDVIMFVLSELDAEGKIHCRCKPEDDGGKYEVDVTGEGIVVCCEKCGATRTVPTDSRLGAHAFLNADDLYLE